MYCAPLSPQRFKKPSLGRVKRIKVHVSALGKSCLEIKTKAPGSASGVYVISATNIGKEFLKVYCDMTTDGGNVYSTIRLSDMKVAASYKLKDFSNDFDRNMLKQTLQYIH